MNVKKVSCLLAACALLMNLACFSDTLSAPDLVSPDNGATIAQDPPQFVWRTVDGADFYWLQVSRNEDFSSLALNVSCTGDTSYAPTTSFGTGTYYWHVLGQEGG
jgi:hypothetical protein